MKTTEVSKVKKLSDFDRGWLFGAIFILIVIGFSYVVFNIDEWIEDYQQAEHQRPGAYFNTEVSDEFPTIMGSDHDDDGHYWAYLEFPSQSRPNGENIFIWGAKAVYLTELGDVVFPNFEAVFSSQGEYLSSSWSGTWTKEQRDSLIKAISSAIASERDASTR